MNFIKKLIAIAFKIRYHTITCLCLREIFAPQLATGFHHVVHVWAQVLNASGDFRSLDPETRNCRFKDVSEELTWHKVPLLSIILP